MREVKREMGGEGKKRGKREGDRKEGGIGKDGGGKKSGAKRHLLECGFYQFVYIKI